MRRFASLRRQTDFTRLRRFGHRVSTKSLVIYRTDPRPGDPSSLVGITVGKNVGKAVMRNTIRRRLAAIVDSALAQYRTSRLLLIARPPAADAPFGELVAEVTFALDRA